MKRLYIFIFLVGLLGNNIMYAQIPASSQSLPSPNVAALGLYGEIPMRPYRLHNKYLYGKRLG